MLEEQAYDRIDAADDAVADTPPAVGPGGLQNVSKTSAWAAGGGVDAAPMPRAHHLKPRRRPPPEPRASPQTRLEHRVRQSLRQTTTPISHGPRASKHERRRVALAVVAVHVFLARKLGACTLPVVALGAVAAVFALRHHDDDAALRAARGHARRAAVLSLEACLRALRDARVYYAHVERVMPAPVLRFLVMAWGWRVAAFLGSPERCATLLRHLAVVGAALAAYAASTARTAPSLAVAVGALHGLLALVERALGADAVALAVAGLAWSRPGVGSLRDSGALRSRDFGVARVSAGPARGGGLAARSEVYLGACMTWVSARDLSIARRGPPD